ncbi:hypothetical protein QE152_g18983 [Popillia japonica]|uniref:Uncharacterized protein n=1 Tax=Popillia japonica TaxID=7064 RepID=A0AAW1L408_POPJA
MESRVNLSRTYGREIYDYTGCPETLLTNEDRRFLWTEAIRLAVNKKHGGSSRMESRVNLSRTYGREIYDYTGCPETLLTNEDRRFLR